ncbi:MAG: UDP-N-acetylmuramoyl-tripeptide--D-alanyl-D-alanine ligase [Rubrivivax sp.]|nr:UDP-N-acetylmuramoyl-tripeptide--D-alanyl-D-alanine ligase [Rubrivivax sp.]
MMTLATANLLLPGSVLVGDPTVTALRVHTDTRTLRPGDLFVALKGERFDAHDFLPAARDTGAVAAIAERGLAESGLPGLRVPDTLQALQSLAGAWRSGLLLPLIAITGSNGKTTVTQMVSSILRAWVGDAAVATAGNLNNHIGVPLTLLRLSPATRAAVVELGMNHVGEIAELAALAAPTVALVNNAQREHQEFMHSVEAVARENGAVIAALPSAGTAVFPHADRFSPLWRELAGARRVLSFAVDDESADVFSEARWEDDRWRLHLRGPKGAASLMLHQAGRHNVANATAAAAAAMAAGAPLAAVVAGLQAFRPVKGRSALRQLPWRGGVLRLVDDSYNANPDSVLAAIDVLADLPRPRWLVLGDMGEVGQDGPAYHAEVGRRAAERGIDALWCAGALSAEAAAAYGPAARHFTDAETLVAALADAPQAASVLVKGSRFMRMEQVVQSLEQEAGHAA